MRIINRYMRVGLAGLTLCTFLLNSVPIKAQGGDIVGSDDISGGSSVFVFRKSRNTAQSKFVTRTAVKQTTAQKAKSRQSVRAQVAKAPATRSKAPKVDPNTVAQNTGKNNNTNTGTTGAKTAGTAETSVVLAGAGETYLERGDTQKAITYFREAIKLDSKNEVAKQGLSEALTRYADSVYDESGANEAKPIYEEAIQLDSKNAAAFAALASIYDDLDNTELAFQNYEQALKLNPNLTELYAPIGVAYYQKKDIAKAEEYLVKAVNIQAEDEQTQFLLGVIRYKQQRYNEAITALNKSLQIKDNAEAHYYLGEIYDKQDRSKDAIAQYTQAVKLNPRYTDAWFDLGVAQYNHNNYEEAINAYKQAITLKNDNYEFYENLADVYRQLGFNTKDKNVRRTNYQYAESYYNLAITFAERNKDKINETALADLYSKQGFVTGGLNKWEATINVLDKAVAISADSVDYTNLGWAYYNSAQADVFAKREAQAKPKLEKARDALQKATAMDSRAVGAFMNLGVTLIDLGDAKGAIEALKKCVALRDKWIPALNELGLAYYIDKNYDEAIKNFKKTVDLDKNFSSGLYNWSRAEFARGNLKEARNVQERLRKIDPNRANALEALFLSSGPANQIQQKVNQKNPLNKLPRFPY